MLGTSMVIGDGVLTPCISVLSAVGGIKEAVPAMTEEKIVWISVAILIGLFSVQRLGTDKKKQERCLDFPWWHCPCNNRN
ncbi:hypothetical protein Q3G72_034771 [Acer saccharum]|nr:hypothetical protein Q3G72_034771 [Acer saccharum]